MFLDGLIFLLLYDFDGVMIDNKVIVGEDDSESVTCSRSGGLVIFRIK
jgi:hypothetical protein